jgi:hypothetical protein
VQVLDVDRRRLTVLHRLNVTLSERRADMLTAVLRGIAAALLTAVALAGCGGRSTTPDGAISATPSAVGTAPPHEGQTALAIAQFVEANVAALEGQTNDGKPLGTTCVDNGKGRWFCMSAGYLCAGSMSPP